MNIIDPDYVVALYLQNRVDSVPEQCMMRELVKIVKKLWEMDYEVEVSFHENAAGDLVSPEIVSSLHRLRQSGLVEFNGAPSRITFKFIEPTKNGDPRADILPSHSRSLGRQVDGRIQHILQDLRNKMY